MIPESIESVVLGLYFLCLLFLCIFGFHGYVMVYLYNKYANRKAQLNEAVDEAPQEWPKVTVQLPVFNELYVVERLITAACALDYPRDKLHIQVLDDSTDETVEASRLLVKKYRRAGIDIELLHRKNRAGYKAGALREALPKAKGEFIAIFDADFMPPAHFLRVTIPKFRDPKVGMVQSRWGHLNQEYSLLTKIQAIGLDGHFVVEQGARNRAGFFINFNGTAGIWRKRCIIDAGNWSDDTLTEDLDLSYRAQMRGWRFIFLQDLVCMSEIPAHINALKSQQFRWTKGAIETAKKILPKLWKANLPFRTKLQGTLHLTNNLVFPFILLVALLNLPLLLIKDGPNDHSIFFGVSSLFVLAFFGSFAMYSKSQREIYPDWRLRLRNFPAFMAGSMGLSASNTRAIVQGLFNIKSAFQRTPKFRIVSKEDSWIGKKYQMRLNVSLLLEVFMSSYTVITLLLAIYLQEWSAVPFMGMFAFGFGFITTLSFSQTPLFSMKPHFWRRSQVLSKSEVLQSN